VNRKPHCVGAWLFGCVRVTAGFDALNRLTTPLGPSRKTSARERGVIGSLPSAALSDSLLTLRLTGLVASPPGARAGGEGADGCGEGVGLFGVGDVAAVCELEQLAVWKALGEPGGDGA